MKRRLHTCLMAAGMAVTAFGAHAADPTPHAGMMRYPDVSATHIVFLYANDLWLVPRDGGTALPLASPPGEEMFPRFSPDGSTIAFVGNYDGNRDLYTVPLAGGVPLRATHHPTAERLCDWTPDGRLVFQAFGMGTYPRTGELYSVASTGGLPEQLPVPYGARAAISPDGQWLAYTPHTRDQRTWKRYRGGMATDIWLFHLREHTSRRITEWEGTDTLPMWHGDTIFYLSDGGPAHRLNIWSYSVTTNERHQVTSFTDLDVKWPAIGPGPSGQGEIVFQYGSMLRLLDLASGQSRVVEVTIPGARSGARPRAADAAELILNRGISSTGKRVVLEARGDIWSLPAENGSPRNLSRSSGTAERDPAWSPDGRWIAYLSDAGGEYQLYVRQSDGKEEPRQLTRRAAGFLFSPTWSPDSKHITVWDNSGTLYLVTVESSQVTTIDKDPWARRSRVSWSHDSGWIAYVKVSDSNPNTTAIWLYDVRTRSTHKVTNGRYTDTWPTFDRKGELLYFASLREFTEPIYDDAGTTWVYANADRLYAVPLRADVASPLAPESDEETWGDDEKTDDDEADKEQEGGDDEVNAEPEPVTIDLEGFESRAIELPVGRGSFHSLAVNDGNDLVYVRAALAGSGGEPTIQLLDLDKDKKKNGMKGLHLPGDRAKSNGNGEDDDKEKTVLEGVGAFRMSADGKKLLVWKAERMAVVDAKPKQKMKHMVSTDGMRTMIDPRAEWQQIFTEVWRLQRDFFYDPNMHGVDWAAVGDRYQAMVADCATREDLSYVLREMISELNVGHAYYFGGDVEKAPTVRVGMPGCDFELVDGAYRIARIINGAPWDVDARGPLSQPGVDVREGDYLLAVNGAPVDVNKDPWAAFLGLADRVVTLTVSSTPTLDGDARDIVVELPDSDRDLRYWSWVEANRAHVSERSGGRVGYIYVPNTGIQGQNHLVRQFYGQTDADALIIDERWNGGGQIPTRFIELLNRPVANYWALRHGNDWTWPPDAHHGPKCMLINGLAGSGGDYFPFWFRATGLGQLVGTRTWGGLVGISGGPRLIDGAVTTMPAFAFYRDDGTWGIEGHGVDPDLEVVDDPALMVGGADPQLDAAIDLMLSELEHKAHVKPPRPPFPDRSGMGIPPEQR